jgi:hypothetical protein
MYIPCIRDTRPPVEEIIKEQKKNTYPNRRRRLFIHPCHREMNEREKRKENTKINHITRKPGARRGQGYNVETKTERTPTTSHNDPSAQYAHPPFDAVECSPSTATPDIPGNRKKTQVGVAQ